MIAYEKLSPKSRPTKTHFSEDNLIFNEFRKSVSFEEEMISSYKEMKDNMSDMTSSSSMNNTNKYPSNLNFINPNKDDQLHYLDNYNPLLPDENAIFNINQFQKKTLNQYFSNLNPYRKETKHCVEETKDNDSDKEAKRKQSFQSSFNHSFNNKKFVFSDDEEGEKVKLFSAENSNSLTMMKKFVSDKAKDNKKAKVKIFKAFQTTLIKNGLNNKFPSNNLNTFKNKKLFLINNSKRKPSAKMKQPEKKKFKFVTHTIPNVAKKYREEQDITNIFLG